MLSMSAMAQSNASEPRGAKQAAPAAAFNQALLRPSALAAQAPESYDVKFATTKGDFVVRVTRAWAPRGADRFYNLVKNGYFDGASFFRAVPGFMVQFGISAHPQVNRVWQTATIPDDPVKQKNTRGKITFATAGANTRTTQVFINYVDRNAGFLDSQGFAPFGEVVEGMEVVDSLYGGYGEATTQLQGQIAAGGRAYLEKNFPKLDSIKSAIVVVPANPGKAPTKRGT
jgi:peptidyl-prolyl cis-trans isomerase A (cyclophilin A)